MAPEVAGFRWGWGCGGLRALGWGRGCWGGPGVRGLRGAVAPAIGSVCATCLCATRRPHPPTTAQPPDHPPTHPPKRLDSSLIEACGADIAATCGAKVEDLDKKEARLSVTRCLQTFRDSVKDSECQEKVGGKEGAGKTGCVWGRERRVSGKGGAGD